MDEQLLLQYLTRKCSPADIKRVEGWISMNEANATWLFEMERIWSLKDEIRFSDNKEIEEAFHRFKCHIADIEKDGGWKKYLFLLPYLKYVASILIVIFLSLNLYVITGSRGEDINMVEVPNGQRVSLTLSDGTVVWLNSQSKFSYPGHFSSKKREVRLEGEAFFEVARNEKIPFVIHSSLVDVKVLGTKFNMKAYANENFVVTLTEGKVEVVSSNKENKLTIKPEEQVSYSRESGMVLVKGVDTDIVRSWTKGESAFINKRLDEIVRDLERKFDVRINLSDYTLAEEIFTCRFKESATINQVLLLLKETRKLDFSVQDHQILIYKPKNEKAYE